MKLTEQQLRAIVRESIVRTLQENSLNEGKLGRALGTMALGGALMMGNPQDANAQLDFRTERETPTKDQKSFGPLYKRYYTMIDNGVSLNWGVDLIDFRERTTDWYRITNIYINNAGFYVNPDNAFFIGNSLEEATKTLQSLLTLYERTNKKSYAYDCNHKEFEFNVISPYMVITKIRRYDEGDHFEIEVSKSGLENGLKILERLRGEMDELSKEMNERFGERKR